MRKIKILHISPSGTLYGTERHILSILKYADRDIFEHWVAVPTKGVICDIFEQMGIKYAFAGRLDGYKHRYQGFFKTNGLYNLYNLIRQEKFDIVHSHLNSYGLLVSKLAGAKRNVHTRHGVFWTEEELQKISYTNRYFQKRKSRLFDITVAIGEYEKNTLINIFKYPPEKIRLTYNGVNIQEIQSKITRSLTKKNLFNTEDILIGAVGRLEIQKGFHFFLQAARLVLDKIKNVKFVIVGNGTLHDQLIKMRNDLGMQDYFSFVDYKTDIYNYMNGFDVLVQTSLWEGISYVVLEAMALNKPVIALTTPNTSGVKEIIVHGDTGYLVEQNYKEDLCKYILEIVTNRDKILRFGDSGRRRVERLFTEERTSDDNHKVYLELMNRNK
jgi:glycosyltransferase involved in cell wall biosynthesis